MPQIIPITDLRDTNKITAMCATNEPIFVTKNGYGAMVILSMQAYEEAIDAASVMNGLRDAQEGRSKPWSEVKKSL